MTAHRWCNVEAARLRRAEHRRVPLDLLSRRRPGLSLSEAYRVQACGVALRVADGARVVGHKVGLTSAAMRRQFGIDEPDSGILLDTMAVRDSGVLDPGELIAPRVEAEIAFRLDADVHGPDVGEQVALAAARWTLLALEVVDCRYRIAGITVADSVADNAASARIVLGDVVPAAGRDLRAERLTVLCDGHVVATGEGRAVLGDPIRSLTWLARHLSRTGERLRAGDVVLTGAVHASLPLEAGHTVSVRSPHLPAVSLRTVHATAPRGGVPT